ncbi:hypothetical protein ACWDBF_04585, partial [Streptomyces angustmyceticus]
LASLWDAWAYKQVTALLARDPAAHAALNSPAGVAVLLSVLPQVGADGQVTALLARDPAAHVHLDNPDHVAWLLEELRKVGTGEQATALAERLPAAGHFDQYIRDSDQGERFRFGREPDGSAASLWTWDDLE